MTLTQRQGLPAISPAGLADLYPSHPDFAAHYEAIESGFAEYLAGAMKAYTARLAGWRPDTWDRTAHPAALSASLPAHTGSRA
ncbi:TipAS antibiotic-recognition domain-containing protein [Devosia sp. ZB163]|uniref:TipAS antibiotic-recognition domain-containing protein n=1 Tax=Devosia sp. ZB163 TaxID=3025938 RepID=UPI00235F6159|nr:TipAS antibiotic-recognition domain-containing protein [Devosia sp. ZB163]MDC9824503.1 TipAS antibiotic-recognition domain-containing protein [Devosia sp. ZB163]